MLSQMYPDNLLEDIYYFNEGNHRYAYRFLGSKRQVYDGIEGFQFSVWAPNAWQVYLQGDFSSWANIPMVKLDGGVWTLFCSNAEQGQCYRYGIDHGNGHIEYKIDPFGMNFEIPPKDASVVWDLDDYHWDDQVWLDSRAKKDKFGTPLQIYEVHPTSWRQHPDGRYYTFYELAGSLIPYVKKMGYTHIEFMPLMDHPLEASWGYQITGYFAVAGRYGTTEELKYFIDQAHQAGIGIILDWVPGHFNRNANALAYFDGTPTYEYQDENRATNRGWGTLNFDLGKNQVQSFLISNLFYWIEEFHVDGVRVDAVSNMLYLDFDPGPWTPNEEGNNINKQGVAFIQKMNQAIHEVFPDIYMIAEESTSREKITQAVEEGGLGFDYKWNMGWMNDVLRFFELDPLYRPENLRLITFVFMYQYKERYILPFSHDEVVHGKRSLLDKIPGSRQDQFATLRLMHAYMLAQPGKVLHFMGNELGQYLEWRYYEELDWAGLQRPFNSEYHYFMSTLNHIGLDYPEFYQLDHDPKGLTVLEADDLENGILSFIRHSEFEHEFTIVICNFTPVTRSNVQVGVPISGKYKVLMNSQDQQFGGWVENSRSEVIQSQGKPWNHQVDSILLELPGLSVLYIQLQSESN
ncbi:1,4-alpha-glucan branching protein GlgB [Facklamia sp. DSM 111018]|uniref:1,4-alpha-glucan branching enzyme n=1 Tax=Facklamia lactis TaxID=2749967 RepID=A0ABS0LPE2_9LACT|nr:1,4-alpha-glucan branching protein GlgB [Facklamia lactis]MBG9980213.1 1,4-alpha-glucan branching protein GlgB [Facklamia lactis]MBG9986016.1 1,4-alpha-glucan branching protein GlgB [Facklamia lactis]